MPTLLQFATLFNVFGSTLVLLLSLVVLRMRPGPFFHSWVKSYAFTILATVGVAIDSVAGHSAPLLAFNYTVACCSLS